MNVTSDFGNEWQIYEDFKIWLSSILTFETREEREREF